MVCGAAGAGPFHHDFRAARFARGQSCPGLGTPDPDHDGALLFPGGSPVIFGRPFLSSGAIARVVVGACSTLHTPCSRGDSRDAESNAGVLKRGTRATRDVTWGARRLRRIVSVCGSHSLSMSTFMPAPSIPVCVRASESFVGSVCALADWSRTHVGRSLSSCCRWEPQPPTGRSSSSRPRRFHASPASDRGRNW